MLSLDNNTSLTWSVIFLGINVGLLMYRKTMSYEQKRMYVLTEKDTTFFDHLENKCRYCEQLLTNEMIHCPNCSLHTAEDIPILVSLKNDTTIKEKFCKNCGAAVVNQKFCTECGSNVGGN